jgi:hypothetical protein
MPKKVRSIRLVFSADEHRRVRLAAAMVDQSVTAFARTTVLSAADLDPQYPRNDSAWTISNPSATDISTPRP